MLLADLLKRENNNLDIFRVIAAAVVICSHAYSVVPGFAAPEVFARVMPFDYTGAVAVKIFFFISGLVVTNSLLTKNNVVPFAIARFFRIWPALIVTLVATAFIIGPIFTSLPLKEYFSDGSVYNYVVNGASLSFPETLPGVFDALPRNMVNASLWTIPREVGAYLTLTGLYLIGVGRSRLVATAVFAIIALDMLTGSQWVYSWLPKMQAVTRLGFCFAFGAVLVLWKDKIRLDAFVILGCWILFYVIKKSVISYSVFYCAVFMTILYLSGTDLFKKLKSSTDASYAMYLWGWPVQQIMASLFPGHGPIFNMVVSIPAAALLGYASWHLVEKRCIRLGSTLGRRYESAFLRQGAAA